MKKTLTVVFFVLGAITFYACNDNGIDYEQMRKEELALLDDYIKLVYPGEEPTSSGLYYFNEEGTGSGDTIKPGDLVQIYYVTWALNAVDDSVFVDETVGYRDGHRFEPYKYVVGTTDPDLKSITGLEEASLYMQPGTRSHLVINSELAYGQNGSGAVGAFQTILMEVEVYKVKPLETEE